MKFGIVGTLKFILSKYFVFFLLSIVFSSNSYHACAVSVKKRSKNEYKFWTSSWQREITAVYLEFDIFSEAARIHFAYLHWFKCVFQSAPCHVLTHTFLIRILGTQPRSLSARRRLFICRQSYIIIIIIFFRKYSLTTHSHETILFTQIPRNHRVENAATKEKPVFCFVRNAVCVHTATANEGVQLCLHILPCTKYKQTFD